MSRQVHLMSDKELASHIRELVTGLNEALSNAAKRELRVNILDEVSGKWIYPPLIVECIQKIEEF